MSARGTSAKHPLDVRDQVVTLVYAHACRLVEGGEDGPSWWACPTCGPISHPQHLADKIADAGLLCSDPVEGTETEVEWSALGHDGIRHECDDERSARRYPGDEVAQARTVTRTPWRDA